MGDEASEPTRVLVADDHGLVREGFVALLEQEDGFEIVAEARDGEEALRLIDEHRPDVALVDVGMPLATGIEVARIVRDRGLATAVVLISVHEEPATVKAALRAGASGYVLKAGGIHQLVEALRVVARGDIYLSPRVATAIISAWREGSPLPAQTPLTARERDVLRLLARGLSSKEIAFELGITTRTVSHHRATIMEKLGVRHVPGLVKYALKHHLTTLDD